MPNPFNREMRDRQLAWARGVGGIPDSALEERHGIVSWVLKREHRKCNLLRQEWWDCIVGKEHRWARALNSSQCFAVNLFGPLKDDPVRARVVLQKLLPERKLTAQDKVTVHFEYTPEETAEWLGERGHPTQIDVYFEITRSNRSFGHLLVEVKFTEPSFASCRGWKGKLGKEWANPDRLRCLDISAVLSDPQANCWMTKEEGRRYWEIIRKPNSSIRLEAVTSWSACPFRHGLYQMMRNRVLADELVRHTDAEWADFAVCRHLGNQAVVTLDETLSSRQNVIEAFRSLSRDGAVRDWNAEELVTKIQSGDKGLEAWKSYMLARYF